jgi:excinuclease UvrABC helicase subunit UvrB
MRGDVVDFAALRDQNATAPTLGNTSTNVRGDVMGTNGVVLKTQEEVEAEWERKRKLQSNVRETTNIKNKITPDSIDFPSVSDLVTSGVIPPNKRRIVEDE